MSSGEFFDEDYFFFFFRILNLFERERERVGGWEGRGR